MLRVRVHKGKLSEPRSVPEVKPYQQTGLDLPKVSQSLWGAHSPQALALFF